MTSAIAKILKSIVRDNIINHIYQKNLIDPSQHGFTTLKSCVAQLLIPMEYWTQPLNSGVCTDIIYLDFKKAFDTVPHARILTKLEAYAWY